MDNGMKKIIDGFIRAITTIVLGTTLSYIFKEFITNLMENEIIGFLVSLGIFAISLYAITSKMKYWGILYTIGWIIGLALMYYYMSSIIEWYEIILYPLISILILYNKLCK